MINASNFSVTNVVSASTGKDFNFSSRELIADVVSSLISIVGIAIFCKSATFNCCNFRLNSSRDIAPDANDDCKPEVAFDEIVDRFCTSFLIC